MTPDRTDGGGGMSERCGFEGCGGRPTDTQHGYDDMCAHDPWPDCHPFTPQPTPPTDEALRALVEAHQIVINWSYQEESCTCGWTNNGGYGDPVPGTYSEHLTALAAAARPAPVLDVERLADILLREFKELYAPSLPGWTGKAKRQDPRPDALADATRLAAAYQTALAARTEGRT